MHRTRIVSISDRAGSSGPRSHARTHARFVTLPHVETHDTTTYFRILSTSSADRHAPVTDDERVDDAARCSTHSRVCTRGATRVCASYLPVRVCVCRWWSVTTSGRGRNLHFLASGHASTSNEMQQHMLRCCHMVSIVVLFSLDNG